jgi:hypothetical protein
LGYATPRLWPDLGLDNHHGGDLHGNSGSAGSRPTKRGTRKTSQQSHSEAATGVAAKTADPASDFPYLLHSNNFSLGGLRLLRRFFFYSVYSERAQHSSPNLARVWALFSLRLAGV